MHVSKFADKIFSGHLFAGSHPTWAGENDAKNLDTLNNLGITTIISLESEYLEYVSEKWTGSHLKHVTMIEETSLFIEDFTPPTLEQLRVIGEYIKSTIEHEKIFIHCRGGIGRTGTILAYLYMSQTDCSAKEAIDFTRKNYNPWAVETQEQIDILYDYKDKLENSSSFKI